MLLDIKSDVIKNLSLMLTFDDGSIKREILSIDDTISITFNKNGTRKTLDGFVKRIETDNSYDKQGWYILVDGSEFGTSIIEKIYVNYILDVTVLKKANETRLVSTTADYTTMVTDMRINEGVLQVSQDHGTTWKNVITF